MVAFSRQLRWIDAATQKMVCEGQFSAMYSLNVQDRQECAHGSDKPLLLESIPPSPFVKDVHCPCILVFVQDLEQDTSVSVL